MNLPNNTASGKKWQLRTEDERQVLLLQQRFGISDVLSRILVGRGIDADGAEEYLNPSLRGSMIDPLHLRDMEKAIQRLATAVNNNETIGVFGDYDVDGATSSALLKRYFLALNIKSEIYIPDRTKDGYGPNIAAFRELKAKNCQLIITVDCGAVAFDVLAEAKQENMDIIVLDHHTGAAELPEAVAVVNPNRLDETSEYTYLAAVGVVFVTLVALNRHLRDEGYFAANNIKEPNLLQWLDIVALGTICDVVPLKGLNRALVHQGIKIMSTRQNIGINQLLDIAGVNEKLSAYHAGFVIGPRINAGGRVGKSSLGSDILSSDDESLTHDIANQLDNYNAERKAIESLVQEQAMAMAEQQIIAGHKFIMVAKEGWHEGVIGIVAGRIKDRFDLPSAVLSIKGDVAKASARSVAGIDVGALVASARELGTLLAGGGHKAAAGFSLNVDNLTKLHDYFEENIKEKITDYHANSYINIDANLDATGITIALANEMEKAAPYGMGNSSPTIAISDVRVKRLDILKDKHISLQLTSKGKGYLKAIAFNVIDTPLGEMLLSAGNGRKINLLGKVKINHWQGRESVNFHIDDAAFE